MGRDLLIRIWSEGQRFRIKKAVLCNDCVDVDVLVFFLRQ